MRTKIHTIEQAQNYRYGLWGGMPKGMAYDPFRCAEEIWENGRGGLPHQCRRKNGKGINGLYCGVHAKWHLAEENH